MSVFFSPQQDVGHGRSHNYDTNSIILVGLKVHQWPHLPSFHSILLVVNIILTITILLIILTNMERFWKLAQEQPAVWRKHGGAGNQLVVAVALKMNIIQFDLDMQDKYWDPIFQASI